MAGFFGNVLGAIGRGISSIFGTGASSAGGGGPPQFEQPPIARPRPSPQQSASGEENFEYDPFMHGVQSPFSSSNVAGGSYDPNEGSLDITYKNGGIYRYHGVSPTDARSFHAASSPGKWVWDHLRLRGTVWGYQVPYSHIGGSYTPRYAMSQKHKEQHRTIGPEGMTPLSWRQGKGPYHPSYGIPTRTAPHPFGTSPEEIETHPDYGKIPHFAAGGTVGGDGYDNQLALLNPGEGVVNSRAMSNPNNKRAVEAMNSGAGDYNATTQPSLESTQLKVLDAIGKISASAAKQEAMVDNVLGTAVRESPNLRFNQPTPQTLFGGAYSPRRLRGGGGGGYGPGFGGGNISAEEDGYDDLCPPGYQSQAEKAAAAHRATLHRMALMGAAGGIAGQTGVGLVSAGMAGGPAGVAVEASIMMFQSLKDAGTKVVDLFSSFLTSPKAALSSLAAPYASQVGSYSPATIERFNLALDNVSASVGRIFEPIIDNARAFADELNVIITSVGPEFRGVINELMPPLRAMGREGFMVLLDVVRNVIGEIRPLFAGIDDAGKDFGDMLRIGVSVMGSLWDIAKLLFDPFNIIGSLTPSFENAKNALQEFAASLQSTIRQIARVIDNRSYATTEEGRRNLALWFHHDRAEILAGLRTPAARTEGGMTIAAQQARYVGIEDVGREARQKAFSQGTDPLVVAATATAEATATIATTSSRILEMLDIAFPEMAAALRAMRFPDAEVM